MSPATSPTIPVNANIDLSAITSVFVARYESQLIDRKTSLQTRIKELKSERDAFDDQVKGLVNATTYDSTIPFLSVDTRMGEISVCWEWGCYGRKEPFYTVECEFVRDGNVQFTYKMTFPVPADIYEDRKATIAKLTEAEMQLVEVLTQLKQVGQKERQIRGKIAEQSLMAAGMSDLLSNPELAQLVMIGN